MTYEKYFGNEQSKLTRVYWIVAGNQSIPVSRISDKEYRFDYHLNTLEVALRDEIEHYYALH